jgi:hypothetical protein
VRLLLKVQSSAIPLKRCLVFPVNDFNHGKYTHGMDALVEGTMVIILSIVRWACETSSDVDVSGWIAVEVTG